MTLDIDREDPYLWLEDLDGERARAWVLARNEEGSLALSGTPRFADLLAEARDVLDSVDRVPFPTWRGDYLYNLWRDEANPRGLWRRATLDQYRRDRPQWQVLLDLDELSEAEAENWVWHSATALRPRDERYLISLSRGGSDARVVREFDVTSGSFVEDGFELPEAKSDVAWIDQDHIYVGTNFGPGSLTSSGYPRVARVWRRGTALAEAVEVFAGESDDVHAFAHFDQTPGFPRHVMTRLINFYRRETWLRLPDGRSVRLEVPEDAVIDIQREWLVLRLRTDWCLDGKNYPAGALLVADLDRFLAGERALTILFTPDERSALRSWDWTRNHLILNVLSDVRSRLVLCTPQAAGWHQQTMAGASEFSDTAVVATNPDHSDEYLVRSTGFVEPVTLNYGQVGEPLEPLKREPDFFDGHAITVRQFFATSADGTEVPYFVVGDPAATPAPVLLSGYGGFEVSRTPNYGGVLGRAWLARGATYAVANIRGGGEYGPRWHRAALRERRFRAFEDFAAVAGDLVARGITTPDRLGITGGSNGGLLMGVMLTRYPHLFGAVVGFVPLLDMRRYHRLLAGASWVAEYGDPDDVADWAFLSEYSPYHNIRGGTPYPPALFVTSTRDDRVHPGHARKMVARLRELGHDVTYYENVEGGHGAAADNAQVAYREALMYEFLWQRLAPTAASVRAIDG